MAEVKLAERPSSLIGRPIDRTDGPLKVTGAARYAAEYDVANTVYGFPVGSTIACGRIDTIDTGAAERAPGVLAVITHRNAGAQARFAANDGENAYERARPVLNTDRITYHGQYVALVLADTYENARAAAASVQVRYAEERPALDFEAGRRDAYKPKVINAGAEPDTGEGDFDKAFARAAVKVDATYETPCEHNNPMEPHATIAAWDGDVLTLYDASQSVTSCRSNVAQTFEIPEEKVRVISRFTGGGFGSKYVPYGHVILAALGAREIGRPVKLVLTRQQMFPGTSHRTRTAQRMRLGAARDGGIEAIAHESWVHTSTHDEFVEQVGVMTRSMYAGANRLTRHRVVRLNVPTPDIMRAPGECPGSFALESAMDELAMALDMDPVALRIGNEPSEDPEMHVPFSSRSLVRCLREGADRFGWARRGRTPRTVRDGRWLVGCGVASATYPTRLQPAGARIVLTADGRVTARLAATEIGVGTYVALGQIAGDALGLPLDAVTVEIGDTAFPPTPGSGGSFGLASAGSALHKACVNLRSALVELALADPQSPLRGLNSDAIDFVDGRIVARGDPARGEPLSALVARAARSEIMADGEIAPDAEVNKKYAMHAYGAHFVEVGVDEDTGEVRLRRMLGVFAAGRIINPKTARSQLIGGMVMGVGMALHEESVVDPRYGHFVNHDLAEYHVPVHADIPAIDAVFLEERDDKINPLGAKGVGELGIVGAAAAVANAVCNATGVRVRSLPITLDKLL
jgi:xanthine dehydrogenase YagR molybdenum-binding subunit